MDEQLEATKDRAWRKVAAIDAAYARGELDDEGWHQAMAAFLVPAYLNAMTPQGGSGHTGTAADWEWSRGVVSEALVHSGCFLDIGCANGLLLESLVAWGAAACLQIEPYGLDIAPALAEQARQRLVRHAEQIFVGNALGWKPPRRFDYVRTGLEYVPPTRRRELVAWLLDEVVVPGGRLIIGKYNEEVECRAVEQQLGFQGFPVAGRADRAHRTEPRLAYRVVWLQAPHLTVGELSLRCLRRSDLPLLQHWLSEPHVETWWRQRLDLAAVKRKYGPRIDGSEPSHMYLIEYARRPIGWLQWYRWRDYPAHAEQLGAELTTAGLDLAIGEADMLGRGIGPQALRLLIEQVVFADRAITACFCDPEQTNTRSLRAFAKAGFQTAGTVRLAGEQATRQLVRLAR